MLKNAGHLLIALGFLAGAWVAVQDRSSVDWAWYAPAMAAGAMGVVLARRGSRQRACSRETLDVNMGILRESLENIVAGINELDARKDELNPHDAQSRIDGLFPEDLARFAEARESIAHRFGLEAYAGVMNHFAAGERYLNRVWSASVDGYIDEVREYIGRAREQFETAMEKMRSLQEPNTGITG